MEQTNVQNESANLISAVKNLWVALTKTANRIKELNAENKELSLRANEIEKLWFRYNELKEQIPALEEKSAMADKLTDENTHLKKENYHLQTSLSELREIEKNFRIAQAEFSSKNKLLHENAQTIEELKSKISEFDFKQKDYDEKLVNSLKIEQENEKLIVELAHLNKELEQKTNEILKLSSDLSDSNAEVKRLKSVKQSYEETIADLNKEYSEFERKARIKEEENLALQAQLEDFDASKIQLDELRTKHLDLTDKSRNLEIQFNYLKADFEEKDKLSGEYLEKIKTQENLIDELLEVSENKDHQIKLYKEAESKTVDLIREKEDYKSERENLTSKIQQLNAELQEIKNESIKELGELSREKEELKEGVERLNKDLLESRRQFIQSKNEWQNEKNNLLSQIRQINDQLENNRVQIAEGLVYKNKFDELSVSFEQMKATNDQLLNDVSERSKERCDLLSQFEQLKKEQEETKKQNDLEKQFIIDKKKLFEINDDEKIQLLSNIDKYIGKLEKITDKN